MYKVQNFTTDARQKISVQLPDGTKFILRLYFSDTQQGWFITELTYGDFSAYGIRLVNALNLLRQFRNKIPFGLYVTTISKREPMLISDLNSGATGIFVLSADEVNEYERYISGD